MIFEQIATGGCQSHLVGCADTCAAALIDPELSQVDRYAALAARESLPILPRGQLELRVSQDLPDPTPRILAYCEFGRISTLAAATLRGMGYPRTVAPERGMKAWREAGFHVRTGKES